MATEKEIRLPTPSKNLKYWRVLVAAPQNKIKMYAWPQYIERAKNLTYKNYDLFFVDNSKTIDNSREIMKQGFNCHWLNPKNKANQLYIAESLELIRRKAINEKYDVLVILETDIIPPVDFIERLLLHQKHVVSGAYFIGHGGDSHLMLQEIEPVGDSMRTAGVIGNGRDILYADGKLHKIYAAGLGCILMHKEVFTKFNFRWHPGTDAHPDSFFANDLDKAGYEQYVDTSFICEHHNQSWAGVVDQDKYK